MSTAVEDDDQAIDEETKADAEKVLGYLSVYEIPPPKIFSHGGDAVVFTWDSNRIRRYLTVSCGEISILDINLASCMRCQSQLVSLGSIGLDREFEKLESVKYFGT